MCLVVSACAVDPQDSQPTTSTVGEGSPPVSDGDPGSGTTLAPAPWVSLANMQPSLSESPAVPLDGQVYVIGGLLDATSGFEASDLILAYDPRSDEWSEAARLPEPIHHAMAAPANGLIYIIGGLHAFRWTPLSDVWAFDPSTGEFAKLASLPFPVGSGAAVASNGFIYVVGGVNRGNSLLRYDSDTDVWVELASMAEPREHLAAAAHGGLIYALGGRFGFGLLSSVEVYDPDTDTWSNAPPMSVPRSGFAAAVLNGNIYVTGGEDLDLLRTFDSGEVLASDGESWAALPAMPVGLHGHGMVAFDGQLLVIGGSRQASKANNVGDTFSLRP